MPSSSRLRRFFACLGLLGLGLSALAGCVPGGPPISPISPLGSPQAAAVVTAAAAHGGTVVAALPAAAAATVTPAPPTSTPAPTETFTPSPSPTITLTPTVVQGVKDTNVLVSVQLVRVIDGATIEVMIKGKKYQVRYLGIEPPAGGASPAAWEAKALAGNKRLVAGQALRLETDVTDTDGEGRLLRYVYTKTYMVNAEMVRYGYARALTQAPDTRYHFLFDAMQADAKAAKRGLWASNP